MVSSGSKSFKIVARYEISNVMLPFSTPGMQEDHFCHSPDSHLRGTVGDTLSCPPRGRGLGWSASRQGVPTERTDVSRILVNEPFLLIRMNRTTTGLVGNQPSDGSHRSSGGLFLLESGFNYTA